MNKNYHDALDAAARSRVPENLNLYPRIALKLEKKTLMQTLRARPALMILLVLLALSLLTGVAYAVGRSLGYIPGVGLVEQGAPIRVLAEPVTQTRDGIKLTVSEAVLTSDKTVVLFSLENVPWSALSHDENVGGCYGMPWVRLPNGSSLAFQEGGAQMRQSRFVYSAVPMDVREATLILPCIQNTLPGLAPENWQVPLRFKPAPADMTVVPVIEIISTATPVPSSSSTQSGSSISKSTVPTANTPANTEAIPVELKTAMQVGDEYVLTGITRQPDPASASWIQLTDFHLIDAYGQEVFTETPKILGLPNFDWGAQFKANTVTFPVTLTFSGVRIGTISGSTAEFEFDAGKNPQPGQQWTPNQSIQIGGRTVILTTIRADSRGGYSFEFSGDPDVSGLSLEIAGYTPNGGGGGGGSGTGQFGVSVSYAEVPKGKLRVLLSNLAVASSTQIWKIQWSPENPQAAASLYGISFVLDKFIPNEDGYYLVGHTEWTDKRIKAVNPPGMIQAFDANGREIPLEPIDWQTVPIAPGDNQWAYKIFGKVFNAPVTLHVKQVGIELAEAVRLELDLRPYNFTFSDELLNMPYKTGITPLDIPGLTANAFKATYIKSGDQRGFEIGIEADPRLLGLTFSFESGLDTSGMSSVASGGGYHRDEEYGLFLSQITTDAPMSFPLVLSARLAYLGGDWTVDWNPPAPEAGAEPVYITEACVTLEKWKDALKNPATIPSDLPNKVLLARGAVSPDPSLFITNLFGNEEKPLVFGQGTLSPDGRLLAYTDENNRLMILEISSGQKKMVGDGYLAPFWSPDGTRIALLRQTGKGFNIFVMDANGQGLRALTDVTTNPELSGWLSDGKRLVYALGDDTGYYRFETLDTDTGEVAVLVSTKQGYDSGIAISPDGQSMAYIAHVPGRIGPGLYISRLDGSDKRLLVQLDYWAVSSPFFSPDGHWLAISVMNTDQPDTPMTPALVNVETCQVVPLPALQGEIHGWVR